MPVTVVVLSGAEAGLGGPALTLDAPMIVLGRGESCDVRLPDPSVSARHATLRQRGSEQILQDEGSTNGTFIGEVRLSPQAPRVVRHGDRVRLGRVWLELRFDEPLPTAQPQLATKEIALALVARALEGRGEQAGPRLVVVEGPDAGKTLALIEPGRAYVLGRSREADLALDDPDASRRHVQVVRRGDGLVARDLGSKNGATLGGEPLPTDRDAPWRSGHTVALASSVLVYEHAAADALAELERAGDERIREADFAPEPPRASARAAALATAEAAAAPVAPLPGAQAAVRRGASGPSIGGTDLAVVLVALAVLALSAMGLWLLFKT